MTSACDFRIEVNLGAITMLSEHETKAANSLNVTIDKYFSNIQNASRRMPEKVPALTHTCAENILKEVSYELLLEWIKNDEQRNYTFVYWRAAFIVMNSAMHSPKLMSLISSEGAEISALNCFMKQQNKIGSGVEAINLSQDFKDFMSKSIFDNQHLIGNFKKPESENVKSKELLRVFIDSVDDPIALLKSFKPMELIEFIVRMGEEIGEEDILSSNIYGEGILSSNIYSDDDSAESQEDRFPSLFNYINNIHKDPFIAQIYLNEISEEHPTMRAFIKREDIPQFFSENAVDIIKLFLADELEEDGPDNVCGLSKVDIANKMYIERSVSHVDFWSVKNVIINTLVGAHRNSGQLSAIDNLTAKESGLLLKKKVLSMSDLDSMKNAFNHHKGKKLAMEMGL